MPLTSSESDPLTLLADAIEGLEKTGRWAKKIKPVALRMCLGQNLDKLKELQKMLASPSREVKVLIALHGDFSRASRSVAVKAASSNLKVFLVDHRLDTTRPIEVERIERTATVHDFREAVHDEIAEFAADARRFSSSDLATVVSGLE